MERRFEVYIVGEEGLEELRLKGIDSLVDPKNWNEIKQNSNFEGSYSTKINALRRGMSSHCEYVIFDSKEGYVFN